MELQKDDMDLSKVRKLFNAVVEDFPKMSKYLLENSEIIQNPEFENAIVKAIDSKPIDGNEQMLLKDFKKTSDISVISVASTTESYAERVLKKQKLEQANADSSYEVSFVCPTSNIAERLFSQSGNIATKSRAHMNPTSLEETMFLKYNSSLWNLKTVESVL